MIGLSALNSRLIGYARPESGEGLTFDCPSCGPKHAVTVYFKNPVDGGPSAPKDLALWQRYGEKLEEITVDPSIRYACIHGWVNHGKWFNMVESPLIAMLNVGGRSQLVALSPVQALALAEKTIVQAKAMLEGREPSRILVEEAHAR